MEDIIKKGRNRNMSKMYQRYLELKKINPNQIYLFKSGIFYLFLEREDREAKKIYSITIFVGIVILGVSLLM